MRAYFSSFTVFSVMFLGCVMLTGYPAQSETPFPLLETSTAVKTAFDSLPEKIEAQSNTVLGCAKLVRHIQSGAIDNQALFTACKAIKRDEFRKEHGFNNPAPILVILKQELDALEATVAELQALSGAPSACDANATCRPKPARPRPKKPPLLHLVSVEAGHFPRAICEGNEPLQRMFKACFSKTTPASNANPEKTEYAASRFCNASGMTVAKLCGYEPAPQGKNSIQIKYKCGTKDVVYEFKTRTGADINIFCDDDQLSDPTSDGKE